MYKIIRKKTKFLLWGSGRNRCILFRCLFAKVFNQWKYAIYPWWRGMMCVILAILAITWKISMHDIGVIDDGLRFKLISMGLPYHKSRIRIRENKRNWWITAKKKTFLLSMDLITHKYPCFLIKEVSDPFYYFVEKRKSESVERCAANSANY